MLLSLIRFITLSSVIYGAHSCPSGWLPSLMDASQCYFVAQQQMSWMDAESYCQNMGPNSHLASILSSSEMDVIKAIAGNSAANDEVWIGAKGDREDAIFSWVDRQPCIYTNWLAGEPSLLYPCVSSLTSSNGQWRTDYCEVKKYFVCKHSLQPTATPTDCYDWSYLNGNNTSGVYRIYPPGTDPFDVWCDMTTDGGGWTVFQKRLNNNTIFWNRSWAEYKAGFNNGINGNYWLGLDRINALSTKDSNNKLRIDLYGNHCLRTGGGTYHCDYETGANSYFFGEWGSFRVENEANKYRLHISPFIAGNISSTDSDPLYFFNNDHAFTTVDVNNQPNPDINCARINEMGAWWYDHCSIFFLNGRYYASGGVGGFGFAVEHVDSNFDYGWVNPVHSEIKMRKIVSL
uniref:Uncharacterized protein n=1 Tax=Plectus sambesii TaxID=2011161 RepID=A0A914V8L2_9BILA